MANIKSAIKRIRRTARQREINRWNRGRLRTQVKKLTTALDQKDAETARGLLRPTIGVVDRAVQKGILKKNTASRMKSRLSLRLNALATGEKTAA